MDDGTRKDEALAGPISSNPAAPAFAEWWDGMLWHRVLRSPVLGLRPGRLGIAFILGILVLLLLSVGMRIDAWLVPGGAVLPWERLHQDGASMWLWQVFIALPGALVRGWPITMLVMVPVLAILGAVLLGAISRMAAEEFSQGRHMSWHEGVKFAGRRWQSLVGAYLGPLLLVWLVALILAALGWVLMSWPGLNMIGGLVYGLFLLAALVAVVVAVAFILGEAMLIPAVVCEGADAIDALQRAYAYVLARPVRLIMYLVLGLVAVLLAVGVLALLAWWTIGFAAAASGAWAHPRGWNMVWWGSFAQPPPAAEAAEAPAGTYGIGAAFIRIWVLVPLLLVLASLFSTAMATATVIYLAMRRVCDGQDVGELWTPGAVEAAMAEVMASRAEAGQGLAGEEGASDLRQADYQ